MRILHLDSGRDMQGGQWQSLRLHQGLLERGHHSVLLRRDDIRPLRLAHLSRQFDIVHAHDAHSHTLCALFARRPFVVSRRVAFPVGDSFASRWKYSKPALYLAVSIHVANQLRQAGIANERIRVVYDGVPLPGTLANGDLVLALPHKRGNITQGIHITNNLEADLPHARAMLYVSRSEGLGSGILLAMAHGVPVIATRTGGIPEIITDNIDGVFIESDNLQQALAKITGAMPAAARRTVEQRFTLAHMIDNTLAAYREALQ